MKKKRTTLENKERFLSFLNPLRTAISIAVMVKKNGGSSRQGIAEGEWEIRGKSQKAKTSWHSPFNFSNQKAIEKWVAARMGPSRNT